MPKMKIGPHMLMRGDSDATQMLFGGSAMGKCVNCGVPAEFLGNPNYRWVGRCFENAFDPNNPAGGGWSDNPVLAARAYIDRFLARSIEGHPAIELWESSNEPVITQPERMTWLAHFNAEFARVLRVEYGKTAVIGNFSVGNPHLSLWPYYLPALSAARMYQAVLGRHSYGPLDEDYALRHRQDARVFEGLGFPGLKVIIGECGAENLTEVGWRTWRAQFGQSEPERAYATYLIQLDMALEADKDVLAAFVFTYGEGWAEYSLNTSGVGVILRDYGALRATMPVPAIPPLYTLPQPPVSDGATHLTTTGLNVRRYPYTGNTLPPVARVLAKGARVKVQGWYKRADMLWGWACLSTPESDEWVSGKYLVAI